MPLIVAPSLLSADFGRLADSIAEAEAGGADWIHLDIMDGHFVPNITFGPPVIRSLRPRTRLPFDTHLMIRDPDRYLEDFREAGADHITVHVETCPHLHRTVTQIRKLGARPGVSLNPSTPGSALREILPFVDIILVMTVNPGFGGQEFIPSTLAKISEISRMCADVNPQARIEVDGGIDDRTARRVVEAGANVLVAGSYVFGSSSVAGAISALRSVAS